VIEKRESHVPPVPGEAKEHRTVSRVMTILELVSRSANGLSLAQLAAALDAPRSSVHYIVKGLVATGYLTENGAYTLGPAVGTLLAAHTPQVDRVARESMESLHGRFDETVTLCVRIGESVVNIDIIESTQPIRFSPALHVRRPLFPSTAGKCFLAYTDQWFRDTYLDTRIEEPEKRRLAHEELERITRDGIAFASKEVTPDLGGVAAPVFHGEKHVAVLTVAGPRTRIDLRLEEIADAAITEARHVAERLTAQ
jgi:DNA-binding IclR family transcriptional regulator